jgi:hypothetical protein
MTTDEIRTMLDETKHLGDGQFPIPRNVAAIAITHAEQLAHALTLPEIKALVDIARDCRGSDARYAKAFADMTAALAQMEGKE